MTHSATVLPSRADIERVYPVIAPWICKTPVLAVAGHGWRARHSGPDLRATDGGIAQARSDPSGRCGGRSRRHRVRRRSENWRRTSGALAIHAFDQPETIQGQGTLALELAAQVPDVETILLGVGGGGLLAGMVTWYGGFCRIVGVEPERSPTLTRALEAGKPVDAPTESFATSLSPRRIGELVYPIVAQLADPPILVTDAEIVRRSHGIAMTTFGAPPSP